jgi:hypothetical protein
MPDRLPEFRELTGEECDALLAAHHVGRIAFSYRDHVDIEPIHYVYANGWIYGRTAPGTKVRALAHNRWVAFEVDEVNALFDWRSVVVKGALYLLEPNGDGPSQSAWQTALEALKHLIPEALTAEDPTPERALIFRIHADAITGRAATP